MALTYAASSVVGLNDFYDALVNFMVSAGWTVAETIGGTRDKILKSTGMDGKSNLVYRLTASTVAAGNPFKANFKAEKAFPWVLVQGYNAWTVGAPGTGINPYGQVGPWIMGNTIVGGVNTPDTAHLHRHAGTLPLVSAAAPVDSLWLSRTRRLKTADGFENKFYAFDGRRKIYGPNIASGATTVVSWSDLVHGEAGISTGGDLVSASTGSYTILVHDAVTDKDFLYILNSTATLLNQWRRYDVEANTFANLAAPLWAASIPNGGTMCWDGADTIYALHGNTTTEFAKYSISGNSWTTLTAAPQTRSTAFTSNSSGQESNMVYVPNSISGIGQDVIYVPLLASAAVIYRYRVTDNAWDSGAGALTAQQTIAGSLFLIFDGIKYLYHGVTNAAPNHWWRSDVSVAPNSWTDMGTVQTAARPYNGMVSVHHIPCKIRSHATQVTNYWFLGDKDAISVVVKIGTTPVHYYPLQHFGKYNSSNRQEIMTLTSLATGPNGRVTINVDDTSKYHPGENVLFWNQDTAVSERSTIFAILGPTQFQANILNSYPVGAHVGLDPTPYIAVGNGVGLCPLDARGYGSDNETAMYVVEPSIPASLAVLSAPGVRQLYQPVPFSIFNPDQSTQKAEIRGFLKNHFSMSTGAYPNAQAEDNISIDGKTYKFFPDTETSRYTVDTRGVLIGPID